jgi:hypothetical protein
MRNQLPPHVYDNESAIINLDDDIGPGTHWVAYKKRGKDVEYFDSYGNLRPPTELISYLCTKSGTRIRYNTARFQSLNAWNCGHLSLAFLSIK